MLRHCALTIAICCHALSVTMAVAAEWPQFRGPGGMGISEDKGLPVAWSATTHVAWKTPMPGAGSSSPIVVGNQIFLTCFSGYGVSRDNPGDMNRLKRHLVCLDRAGGKLLWAKDFPAKLPENNPGRYGYATSTPASDGNNVYAFFGKTGVFAFGVNGDYLWHASVGEGTHGYGSSASPVLYKDLLIVNASAESQALIALDRKTGRQVWRTEYPPRGASFSTPVLVEVGGHTELALCVGIDGGNSNKLYGFDPDTGKELWFAAFSTRYTCASAVAHDGIVYSVAIDACAAIRAGGRGDVSRSHLLWQIHVEGVVSSPIYHDERLYFVKDSGGVTCVKARDGTTVFSRRPDPPPRGNVYSSLVLGDEKLYFLSGSGIAYVLEAGAGFKLLAQNALDHDANDIVASPAVNDSQLLVRTSRYLYCIGNRGR